jgi:Calcineurin-like phosphoesterase
VPRILVAMSDSRIARVPDDWTVWAFSDSHGVTSGLLTGLRQAGLVDADGHWSAPPRTALVGCGDYIDGGADSAGMVALLQRLQTEAAAAGGAVHPARGNHEAMVLSVRAGRHEYMEPWLKYGGVAALRSFGCAPMTSADADALAAAIDTHASGLFAWLESLPQAVVWRDVCFVHGGLPPGLSLDDFGTTTEEHLWVRETFFDAAWDSSDFAAYRRAGIVRVVFGHTPQPEGAKLFHDGRSLLIDSNAVGGTRLPHGSHQELTLVRLEDEVTLADARRIIVPTHDAPDAIHETTP